MSTVADDDRVASYTRMDQGTVEDYALLRERAAPFKAATAERVLAHMEGLHHTFPGNLIDRHAHSLQTATRAERAGECEELVVAALLHDIGDVLAPENHGELAASLLAPYVSQHVTWLLRHHGIFQGYYFWDKVGKDPDTREKYRGHPAFEMTERFCRDYDQMAFDPDYDTLPMEHFRPMVERVFARTPWGEHAQSRWPLT